MKLLPMPSAPKIVYSKSSADSVKHCVSGVWKKFCPCWFGHAPFVTKALPFPPGPWSPHRSETSSQSKFPEKLTWPNEVLFSWPNFQTLLWDSGNHKGAHAAASCSTVVLTLDCIVESPHRLILKNKTQDWG